MSKVPPNSNDIGICTIEPTSQSSCGGISDLSAYHLPTSPASVSVLSCHIPSICQRTNSLPDIGIHTIDWQRDEPRRLEQEICSMYDRQSTLATSPASVGVSSRYILSIHRLVHSPGDIGIRTIKPMGSLATRRIRTI